MRVIREHLAHHRRHMLACALGAGVMVIGLVVGVASLAIAGAAVCAVGCLSMIRMMVMPRHTH